MMSSCCTLRLKRRRAFSRDSLSWMMTSATFLIHPQSGSDWYLAAPFAGQTTANYCAAAGTAPVTDYRMYWLLRGCTLKGRWHLLINSRHISQGIFASSSRLGVVLKPPHNHPATH